MTATSPLPQSTASTSYRPLIHRPLIPVGKFLPSSASLHQAMQAPTMSQFYLKGLEDNLFPSYVKGNVEYIHQVVSHPLRAVFLTGFTAVLGIMFAIYHKPDTLFQRAIKASLFIVPAIITARYMPKLKAAYKQAADGNPKQGQQSLKEALNGLVFNIAQVYMKPLFAGAVIGSILSLPRVLRNPSSPLEKLIHKTAKIAGITPKTALVKWLESGMSQLSKSLSTSVPTKQ